MCLILTKYQLNRKSQKYVVKTVLMSINSTWHVTPFSDLDDDDDPDSKRVRRRQRKEERRKQQQRNKSKSKSRLIGGGGKKKKKKRGQGMCLDQTYKNFRTFCEQVGYESSSNIGAAFWGNLSCMNVTKLAQGQETVTCNASKKKGKVSSIKSSQKSFFFIFSSFRIKS